MFLSELLREISHDLPREIVVKIEFRDEHGGVIGYKHIPVSRIVNLSGPIQIVIQAAAIGPAPTYRS